MEVNLMTLCIHPGTSEAVRTLAQALGVTPDELLDMLIGPQSLVDLEFIEEMEEEIQEASGTFCIERLY